MKIIKRELKNYEIIQLFNEFVDGFNKEGLNAKYSLMLYKNIEVLTPIYNKIVSLIYNENYDEEYQKYLTAMKETMAKYADRTDQGDIIQDEHGHIRITEMIVEFNAAKEAIENTYKDALFRFSHKDAVNRQVENSSQEVELVGLELDEFPDKAKPFVVGLLTL